MSGWLQICSYMHFNLSRRTRTRKFRPSKNIRTDLQPSAQKREQNGIITIETALVLPLFLFAVLTFCYLFQVMEFQIKLQAALNQTAEQAASYGYLIGRVSSVTKQTAEDILEKAEVFSETGLFSLDAAGEWVIRLLNTAPAEEALRKMAESYIDTEEVGMLRVVDGWDGISFAGSCLRDEERCVIVMVRYYIRVPFVPAAISKIELSQTAVCRLHSGDREYIPVQKEEGTEDGAVVYYVTPNGSVYHCLRECRYLKIDVLDTQKDRIADLRNRDGGKYYPCRLCIKDAEAEGRVYYTRSGSSYHASKNCSSLTRTVLEKTKEEIAGLPPCSFCGNSERGAGEH